MLIALICAQAASVEPLSGGAGYIGAGLLGAVLAWIMFFYLPAKDKQITDIIATKDKQMGDLMAMQDLERERERTDRHDRANLFQKALNEMAIASAEQMRSLQAEHKLDAEKDRMSFVQRSGDAATVMKMAIEKQTLELQKSIGSCCQYLNGNAPRTGPIKETV